MSCIIIWQILNAEIAAQTYIMGYFAIGLLWLVVALAMGFTISYANKSKHVTKVGIGLILLSFVSGITIMVFAISTIR